MNVLVRSSPGLSVRCLTDAAALEGIVQEWHRLWLHCDSSTPFQSPHWLLPWWRHFGGGELFAIEVRVENALVGLSPFFITAEPNQPRTVLLLGTGVTDYLDILAAPGFERDVAQAVLAHFSDQEVRWDICDFQQLRSGASLLPWTPADSWRTRLEVQEVCPVLSLPCSIEQLGECIPRHMLEKLRYYRRRLSRGFAWEVLQAGSEDWSPSFAELVRLHSVRWSARAEGPQPGVLADERVQSFHREVASAFVVRDMLRLYRLRARERTIAALYAFTGHRRTFFYLSGFDPEFAAFSPGSIILGHAIEQAVLAGHKEFDFLRGRETYKFMWGARGRPNHRRRMWNCRQPDHAIGPRQLR